VRDTIGAECREFACAWWLLGFLNSDDWYPLHAGLVVHPYTDDRNRACIDIHVDPDFPGRWRGPPYLDVIRKMADDVLVHVFVGEIKYRVLPGGLEVLAA
jgi:hypothetical protein